MLNQSLKFRSSLASVGFDERYLYKEYTDIIFEFFHTDRHPENKETKGQSFDVQRGIPRDM